MKKFTRYIVPSFVVLAGLINSGCTRSQYNPTEEARSVVKNAQSFPLTSDKPKTAATSFSTCLIIDEETHSLGKLIRNYVGYSEPEHAFFECTAYGLRSPSQEIVWFRKNEVITKPVLKNQGK